MNIKDELIKSDIAEYERRVAYCDNIIKKMTKTKEMWQKRLNRKRGELN